MLNFTIVAFPHYVLTVAERGDSEIKYTSSMNVSEQQPTHPSHKPKLNLSPTLIQTLT